jgi:hypothetical protein
VQALGSVLRGGGAAEGCSGAAEGTRTRALAFFFFYENARLLVQQRGVVARQKVLVHEHSRYCTAAAVHAEILALLVQKYKH